MVDKAAIVSLAQRLIRANTSNPPGNEKAVADILAERLRALGLEVKMIENAAGRPNLLGIWKGNGNGKKKTLFLQGHMDTVPATGEGWTHPPFSATVEGDKLYGRGACDMKGGLAAMVATVEKLKKENWQPKGTLVFIGSANEEMGDKENVGMSFIAPKLKEMFPGESLMVMTDTSDMNIVIAEKGVLWLEVTAKGKEAHGSMPWKGVNAIEKLGKFLLALRDLDRPISSRLLGKGTASVNTISGGYKTNVVPDVARASVDIRLVPGETKESIYAAIQKLITKLRKEDADMNITFKDTTYFQPVEVSPDKPFIREMTSSITQVTGKKPEIKGEHGASGAWIFVNAGFDVLMCGPGKPEIAHSKNEWVEVSQLVHAAEAYASFVKKWLG